MKCPIDGEVLREVRRHKMDVDECPKCKGMWLTPLELDQLEDIKYDVDRFKGSLLVSSVETNLPCPVCQNHLYEFKYRLHQLRLDHCPKQHGFWLDYSEDQRVLEIMVKRKKDMDRTFGTESLWDKTLQYLRWSLFDKNPRSISNRKPSEPYYLPQHVEARPPATPYKPVKLPATCPQCGGPINSMTVIEDKSRRYTCGYCHSNIERL